jgi:hypothetical protein
MRININLWPDCKDLVIKFLKPFYEQRIKFLKEMLKEYLDKKLTIKYHYKTGPITKNENFKQREEKDKQEKLENIIEKVERKFSSTPTKVSNTVVTRSYITSANISSNNSHILDVKRINTCKDKKKNMLDSFLNKEKTNNEFDNAKNVNDSYIDQISFRDNNKAQTQTFTKLRKFRYSKSNFKNINHLEAHNKSEKKKNNSCSSFLFQKLENRKLKLISHKVLNNLSEWQHSVATNKFHSGNFELPLYTLTKN